MQHNIELQLDKRGHNLHFFVRAEITYRTHFHVIAAKSDVVNTPCALLSVVAQVALWVARFTSFSRA